MNLTKQLWIILKQVSMFSRARNAVLQMAEEGTYTNELTGIFKNR